MSSKFLKTGLATAAALAALVTAAIARRADRAVLAHPDDDRAPGGEVHAWSQLGPAQLGDDHLGATEDEMVARIDPRGVYAHATDEDGLADL